MAAMSHGQWGGAIFTQLSCCLQHRGHLDFLSNHMGYKISNEFQELFMSPTTFLVNLRWAFNLPPAPLMLWR